MELNGNRRETGPRKRVAGAFAGAVAGLARRIWGARGALLWTVLAASVLAILVAGAQLFMRQSTNALIRDLRAGKDAAVETASAPPALLEARADFLLTRDRIAEAQPLLDQASLRAGAEVQARMLYNMANARIRAAVEAIGQGHFDKAIPLVALAKSEYRAVLRLEPGDWDARYNLDVALRLVRDLPRGQAEEDGDTVETPSKLWTDLPGIPKGLP